VLCCSGYKPDVLGWLAARRAGVPVVCVSHGWTAATWKVRGYEALDRWVHGRMDAVVCVSEGQAAKVREAGVAGAKIAVIPNAIGSDAFVARDPAVRAEIECWFPSAPRWLAGTAGRFSPEKGLGVLIDAAAAVVARRQDVGFVLFGDGPLRPSLRAAVASRGLGGSIIMPGFRQDLSRFLPGLDLAVMSSFTEGLPIFLLEASAAGVPTVATAVGGVPEVIVDGETGGLVRPGDAQALADRILHALADPARLTAMGEAARARVRREFSFENAGQRYAELFARVAAANTPSRRR
jgi:glycosyltransferase involved in cell wall biosynthesis